MVCPLCEQLHLREAVACDVCGQDLRCPPNVTDVRREARNLARNVLLGATMYVVMVGVNVVVGNGQRAGTMVRSTAPLALLFYAVTRLAAVRGRLSRLGGVAPAKR